MATTALYACTKCNQRYPFEELSQGQQLCKVSDCVRGGACACSSLCLGHWESCVCFRERAGGFSVCMWVSVCECAVGSLCPLTCAVLLHILCRNSPTHWLTGGQSVCASVRVCSDRHIMTMWGWMPQWVFVQGLSWMVGGWLSLTYTQWISSHMCDTHVVSFIPIWHMWRAVDVMASKPVAVALLRKEMPFLSWNRNAG